MEKSSTGCAAFGISDAIINYLIELVTALNKAWLGRLALILKEEGLQTSCPNMFYL